MIDVTKESQYQLLNFMEYINGGEICCAWKDARCAGKKIVIKKNLSQNGFTHDLSK
jgi:hypothetical protein